MVILTYKKYKPEVKRLINLNSSETKISNSQKYFQALKYKILSHEIPKFNILSATNSRLFLYKNRCSEEGFF